VPVTMADMQAFIELLRGLGRGRQQELADFFVPGDPISVARAPGRLDVMGGIADYSGSLVLQLPTQEATFVAAQRTRDEDWQIASLPASDDQALRYVCLNQRDRDALGDYAAARQWFQEDASRMWAAYLAGVALVLRQEIGVDIAGGLRLLVRSDVPEAKGVSSSAALEVATMRALSHRLGIDVDAGTAARLCQKAENLVVGAPCGIMDQMTSALGRADELLALLCQPAEVQGFARLPESLGVWGIDSGIRHAVSGSDYTSVRTGAFMGYRMIAAMAGLQAVASDRGSVVRIEDPAWRGYLANLTPDEFERSYAARLPEQLPGTEFLRKYQGMTDAVTHVQPERNYAIRQPTAHPIYEHARVTRFRELMATPCDEPAWLEMGELMYASHASYSACGLGSSGTDRLVELVRAAGPEAGLFGAKITGGGSGGTVAILGRKAAGPAVDDIARRYARESGHEDYVFRGSSAGAWNHEVGTVE
jgi:galactokinase